MFLIAPHMVPEHSRTSHIGHNSDILLQNMPDPSQIPFILLTGNTLAEYI